VKLTGKIYSALLAVILKTWPHFKKELQDRISQFIPKQQDFNAIRKDTWKRPLNSSLRELITTKNRLWTRYMEIHNGTITKSLNPFVIK